ncbi:MAG: shikimate dehydrogenase [Lachnospiraceae bacterium]|nr:shikimate dehydrogenase [Lachnospiraceae bacterium]
MLDGRTRIYGLIGDPVEHSLSPLIHNSMAEMFKENFVYVPLPVKKEDLGDAIKGAYAFHFDGMNVTVPHKQAVMEYICDIDEVAKQIGAVNTLLWTEDGYKGYNTDIIGLEKSFRTDGFKVEGEEIIMLGAGGASRAVGILLARMNAKCIYILNRTKETAETLAKDIVSFYPDAVIEVLGLDEYNKIPGFFDRKFNVVQATSVGLSDVSKAPIYNDEFYEHVNIGYDLIYNPLETLFMKKTREKGGTAFNGLHMLLSQAVASYEIWHGER